MRVDGRVLEQFVKFNVEKYASGREGVKQYVSRLHHRYVLIIPSVAYLTSVCVYLLRQLALTDHMAAAESTAEKAVLPLAAYVLQQRE